MTKAANILVESTNGFVRIVQIGQRFEVQALSIRGGLKPGAITYWRKLCGVSDQHKAFEFYQHYI